MNQNSTGTQLLTLAIKVPYWLGTPMTLAFRATLKEPPPRWLCLIHFKAKPGVLGSFAESFELSDKTASASVTTLGRTGARYDKPRGCGSCRSTARFAAKGFQRLERSGGARATDYYTGNVGGSFAAAGMIRTRDDNSCGSRLTATGFPAVSSHRLGEMTASLALPITTSKIF